jgi:hypothetical protein
MSETVNGTSSKPPTDAPAALSETAVARWRSHHLASRAAVVVRALPPMAMDRTPPKSTMRTRMWVVKARSMVHTPETTRLTKMSCRPPKRSYSRPTNG